MPENRRDFFRQLIAGGATVKNTRKHVKGAHANDIKLYHGPMRIPAHVAEAIREDPTPHKTGARHLASRYAEADGTVWLFRCQIPAHRGMVGEIVRAPIGQRLRIHCWSAATPDEGYSEPLEIVARQQARQQPE